MSIIEVAGGATHIAGQQIPWWNAVGIAAGVTIVALFIVGLLIRWRFGIGSALAKFLRVGKFNPERSQREVVSTKSTDLSPWDSEQKLDIPKHYDALLRRAQGLKEYAMAHALRPDGDAVRTVDDLLVKAHTESNTDHATTAAKVDSPLSSPSTVYPSREENRPSSEDLGKLDTAIALITASTYPVTIYNIDTVNAELIQEGAGNRYGWFRWLIFVIGFLCLVIAIVVSVLIATGNFPKPANGVVAAVLGVLGAIVYDLFNELDLPVPATIKQSSVYASFARLMVGLLLGYVFYFAFAQGVFNAGDTSSSTKPILLLPFSAGSSSPLAVGILNRAIQAVDVALGLDGGPGHASGAARAAPTRARGAPVGARSAGSSSAGDDS